MRWCSRSFSSSVSLPTFKFRRASAFQKYSTNLKTLPRQGFIKNRGQELNHRGFRSPTRYHNHHTDTKICPNQGPVPQRGTCALCMQSGDRQMLEGKHMNECEWLWLASFPSATLLSEYINLGSCWGRDEEGHFSLITPGWGGACHSVQSLCSEALLSPVVCPWTEWTEKLY